MQLKAEETGDTSKLELPDLVFTTEITYEAPPGKATVDRAKPLPRSLVSGFNVFVYQSNLNSEARRTNGQISARTNILRRTKRGGSHISPLGIYSEN